MCDIFTYIYHEKSAIHVGRLIPYLYNTGYLYKTCSWNASEVTSSTQMSNLQKPLPRCSMGWDLLTPDFPLLFKLALFHLPCRYSFHTPVLWSIWVMTIHFTDWSIEIFRTSWVVEPTHFEKYESNWIISPGNQVHLDNDL